jgi:hypothetical protein
MKIPVVFWNLQTWQTLYTNTVVTLTSIFSNIINIYLNIKI